MDNEELIKRAKEGEIIGNGAKQIRLLCEQVAYLEEALQLERELSSQRHRELERLRWR